jgi:hypothetical protein
LLSDVTWQIGNFPSCLFMASLGIGRLCSMVNSKSRVIVGGVGRRRQVLDCGGAPPILDRTPTGQRAAEHHRTPRRWREFRSSFQLTTSIKSNYESASHFRPASV